MGHVNKLKEPVKLLHFDHTLIPEDLRQMQKLDAEISEIYSQVVEAAEKGIKEFVIHGKSFCVIYDSLYCKTSGKLQVIELASVRDTVRRLGHSILWAGHLGRRRTHSRISKHFYLLGI